MALALLVETVASPLQLLTSASLQSELHLFFPSTEHSLLPSQDPSHRGPHRAIQPDNPPGLALISPSYPEAPSFPLGPLPQTLRRRCASRFTTFVNRDQGRPQSFSVRGRRDPGFWYASWVLRHHPSTNTPLCSTIPPSSQPNRSSRVLLVMVQTEIARNSPVS